jgi:hypothetical protein
MSSSYLSKLKCEEIKEEQKEVEFKTYNEYINNIVKDNIPKIVLTKKESENHEFITENLTNICSLLENLKINNPELENITYNEFVDLFYKNITVVENDDEPESDSEYEEYDEYDDY